jgi:hypothetical protein
MKVLMHRTLTRVAPALVAAAAVIATAGSSVAAHHSFASFDISKESTVTGKVRQVDWTNPHTWIWVDVPNDAGGTDTYGFEGMSPNYLARRGWKRTTLQVGDTITVTYRPLRDGQNGGMFMRGTRPDGLVLTMGGASTEP